jgi:hypothetical protein
MSVMEIPQGVPIDPERIAALTKAAVETHAEADDLIALRDRGDVRQTLEVEEDEDGEDEVHLYFDLPEERIKAMKAKATDLGLNPDHISDRLHVAAWPLAECIASQN